MNEVTANFLAMHGLELCVDYFAMSGPDRETFERVSAHCGDPGLTKYWRYKVKRGGKLGYVPLEEMKPAELEKLAAQLHSEGEQALREAEALGEGEPEL